LHRALHKQKTEAHRDGALGHGAHTRGVSSGARILTGMQVMVLANTNSGVPATSLELMITTLTYCLCYSKGQRRGCDGIGARVRVVQASCFHARRCMTHASCYRHHHCHPCPAQRARPRFRRPHSQRLLKCQTDLHARTHTRASHANAHALRITALTQCGYFEARNAQKALATLPSRLPTCLSSWNATHMSRAKFRLPFA
jgi:hypothetical protein